MTTILHDPPSTPPPPIPHGQLHLRMVIASPRSRIERHLVPLHARLGILIPVHGGRGLEHPRRISGEAPASSEGVGEGSSGGKDGAFFFVVVVRGSGIDGTGGFGLGSSSREEGGGGAGAFLARFGGGSYSAEEGAFDVSFDFGSGGLAPSSILFLSSCSRGSPRPSSGDILLARSDGGGGIAGGMLAVAPLHRS